MTEPTYPYATHLDIKSAVGGDFDWGEPTTVMFYCYQWANYEQAFNPVATDLYHRTNPSAQRLGHPMHGDVLVMGPPRDGDDTNVPAWFINLYFRTKKRLGPEEIARLAVVPTQDEVARRKAEQDQLWAGVRDKLASGGAVDVGGLIIGRLPEEDA